MHERWVLDICLYSDVSNVLAIYLGSQSNCTCDGDGDDDDRIASRFQAFHYEIILR